MIVTAASGLIVLLLSVAVVQGQDDWSVNYNGPKSICAPEGSTVEMPCRYTYPSKIKSVSTTVQEKFWYIKKNETDKPVDLRSDSEYTGRVQYLFGKNICTLKMKNLRKNDSAEYKFRFTTNQPGGTFTDSPGVTLTVTDSDLQVKVIRTTKYWFDTYVSLRCHSECPAVYSSFVWFKNGQKIHTGIDYEEWIYPGSEIWCALEGFEDHRSASVYAPKSPSVSVSPPGDIIEGRSVTLTCNSDAKPAANYTWYKKNENVSKASGHDWTITVIRPEHSGDYYCEARNIFGHQTSTVSLNVGSGSTGSMTAANIVRMSAAVLGAVLLPVVFWIQRKKMSKQQSEGGKRPNKKSQLSVSSARQSAVDPDYENTSAAAQSSADGLHANTRAVEPLRRDEDESAV